MEPRNDRRRGGRGTRTATSRTPEAKPATEGRGIALGAAGYLAGARIVRAVPPGLRHAAAAPGGAAWFALSRAQHRNALDNYAAALGRSPEDPLVSRTAKRAFQNYGRMLMDFLLMGSLSPDELIERVTVDGREHLDAALQRGRGVIMAVPHMGSWDTAGSYAAALGYRISAVAEKFPGSLNDAVIRTRRRFGLDVIMLGRAAVRSITDALQANSVLALVCDLEQGPGLDVHFFGRRAVVPAGPASFALRTGAALMPACQYAVGPSRHHIHLEPPLDIEGGATRESVMQRVIDRFEVFIRERPEQWYAFRPMFKQG